ncbi:HEPN domain-containing protein [Neptuniibacter sp. QD48_55]|uniref:ApeA N-terminal domain 1-containing protein n=1 Tax=Neptuniibacter sp. QD48_55 TaxID=3398212 RepID=UPI0039F55F5B
MRIKEEWKKSGYFWLPHSEDKKIPGTLSILDGGKIELEVVGLFDESIEALNGNDDLSRIIGHIEKDGLVTLEDCFYKTKNIAFGGISKSLVYVRKVISGVAYEQDEKAIFNTVSFTVEGINEWVGITGINVVHSDDFKTATISYDPQEELIYNLRSGFKLHIFFGYTLPGCGDTTEARITHQTYFKLSSEVARDFSEFSKIVHQVTYLLCFALDSTVTISDVCATCNDITIEISEGNIRPANIKLYYQSLPFSEDLPNLDKHKMLFRFSDIRENAEQVFNKWLSTYSIIRPSIGLYFSAVSGDHKYLDGKFLALAQGLETYHRRTSTETLMDVAEFRSMVASLLWNCPKSRRKWLKGRVLYGNEINLGQRIKRVINPYKSYIGNSKQRTKFVRSVVNTRNYLTHYSEELEKDSAKASELWVLCQKMEAVFQLHLLQQLEFKESDIQRILSNNYKLKQKLDEI